jgi:hypothetical protein
LVDQWRREIVEKTNLTVYVHHGPKREKDPRRLVKWDVVITTYDTVRSEGFSNEKTPEDTFQGTGVFLVDWWRIVLGNPPPHPKLRIKLILGRRSSYDQESSSQNVTGLLWIDSGISMVFNWDAIPKYRGRRLLARQIPSYSTVFRVELLERTYY